MAASADNLRMYELHLMSPADIPAMLVLQAECYGIGMNESEAVIRHRLRAAPDSAWVAVGTTAAAPGLLAYLVAYRSRLGKLTALGGSFEPADRPDCLYLHDLAVARRAEGRGLARSLVKLALAHALETGLAHSALVSVQDSRDFWRGLGYDVCNSLAPVQLATLASYEGKSCYMVQSLQGIAA